MLPEDIRRVLDKPISQELMRSAIPARLAYDGLDGFPRVVPVGFHWDGAHIVVGTVPASAKVKALEVSPKVALTIDTNAHPPQVLLVRGTASLELVDGVPSEYLDASRKLVGDDQWEEFEGGVRALYDQMVLITITPEWAKLLDFETTIPSAVEALVREKTQAMPKQA